VVSCLIQAQLTSSPYEFEVHPTGWAERSLLTRDTVRWFWYVTPKVGGTHALVLNLRPIMKLRPLGNATVSVRGTESNVQQYETSVRVHVPWTQRPQETMSRLAATFKVAEGLVTTLTGLVAALVALGAALGIRRQRKRSVAS
jgi:hypothetical protein